MKGTRRDVLELGGSVALLAIAGCSSNTNSATDETTTSHASGTDTPPATTAASTELADVTYPPGWSADGIQDVEKADQTHKAILEGVPFVRESSMDTKQVYDGHADITVKVDPPTDTLLVNQVIQYREEDRSGVHRVDIYIDGETGYRRTQAVDSETYSYSHSEPEPSWHFHGERNVYDTVNPLSLQAETVVPVTDATGIRYSVTGLDATDSRFADDEYGPVQDGTVTITEQGRLDSYDVTFGRKNETAAWFSQDVALSSVGDVSIPEPEWISNV